MQPSTSSQKLNFSAFKTSFASNVFALKRRFSSGDLENEGYEESAKEVIASNPSTTTTEITEVTSSNPPSSKPPPTQSMQQSNKTISAPTSPSRSTSSTGLFSKLQSSVGSVASNITSNIQSQIGGVVGGLRENVSVKIPFKDPGILVLLVIDDHNTDWSKYFKSRKVGTMDIQVEQCEFSELSVLSYESHVVCSYIQYTTGVGRQLRQFVPDFLLIRQNLRDAGRDYKNALLAFMYGGLYSVNSLAAIYNFQDKPWVFAHMLAIQRKALEFPLIEQNFYPDFAHMSAFVPKIPAVLKIGHAHGGLGKIRVGSVGDYQDASSVVAVTGTYATSEPYVEARCDVHIQKIGNQYKAFMRKGIVGHWKSGSGSAMLEQIPMTEKYRSWVDSVATLFGGLDICALEVLVSKDGREWIIEVNDSALTLMGESQEEDRRHIAELVMSRMSFVQHQIQAAQAQEKKYRRTSVGEDSRRESVGSNSTATAIPSMSSAASATTSAASTISQSATSAVSSAQSAVASVGNKLFSRQNSQVENKDKQVDGVDGQQPAPTAQDTEDTMKNLRKTFAGIFGEM